MNVSTLSLVAGTAALIAAGPAVATLTAIEVVAQPQEPGLTLCSVYATFDDAFDHLQAVGGTPGSPLDIGVTGGTFYQHPFGTDRPPDSALFNVFPSLAWDTFVTIGVAADFGVDNMSLMPPWPGFGPSTMTTNDSGWFITPDDGQGAPNAQGRVLIGRFTHDGDSIEGSMLVQFTTGGVAMQASVRFCHGPAAPCIEGDLDGDSLVTIDDFLALLGDWGGCAGCPADIDGDDEVGINDFLVLLGNWTAFSVVPTGEVDGDLNRDGVVNVMDLLILIQCKGPVAVGCEIADLDGDDWVGADDLLLLIADWGPA